MKKSELKIGNYLSYKWDPIVGKPALLTVVEIKYDFARVEYLFEDKLKTDLISFSELEGKTISEYWLMKLGFEIGHPGYYNKGELVITVEGQVYFGESEVWIAEINFVHQLQNLWYALTGEDLTAEPAQIAQTI